MLVLLRLFRNLSLIIALFGIFLPSLVWADGMIIADPSVYFNLIEDQQIAVIEVKENRAVDVDLYISLVDTSGRSNEVKFILPFYENPEALEVKEVKIKEFTAHKTERLDQTLRWTDLYTERIDTYFLAQSFLFFPPAAVLSVFFIPRYAGIKSATLGTVIPEKVITTEHTRTEAYRVDSTRDIEEILKESGLPMEIQDKIRLYNGNYLYITTLKTIPKDKETGGLNALGVQFSFRVPLVDDEYVYPLSTGQVWPHPIKLTRIYAVCPYHLELDLSLPEKIQGEEFRSSPPTKIRASWVDTGPAKVEAKGLKVARVTYRDSNPSEDIRVKLIGIGKRSLLKDIKIGLSKFIFSFGWLFFLILNIFIWMIFFKIFMDEEAAYTFQERRFYVKGLAAFFTLFLPILAIFGLIVFAEGMGFLGLLALAILILIFKRRLSRIFIFSLLFKRWEPIKPSVRKRFLLIWIFTGILNIAVGFSLAKFFKLFV